MNRNVLALLLALALMFAGCGGQPEAPAGSADAPAQSQPAAAFWLTQPKL